MIKREITRFRCIRGAAVIPFVVLLVIMPISIGTILNTSSYYPEYTYVECMNILQLAVQPMAIWWPAYMMRDYCDSQTREYLYAYEGKHGNRLATLGFCTVLYAITMFMLYFMLSNQFYVAPSYVYTDYCLFMVGAIFYMAMCYFCMFLFGSSLSGVSACVLWVFLSQLLNLQTLPFVGTFFTYSQNSLPHLSQLKFRLLSVLAMALIFVVLGYIMEKTLPERGK